MTYKFEKLDVWKLALRFNGRVYRVSERLPECEKFNLTAQVRRASTSIALNIAEGSTGQSDAEQARFLSFAIRSHVEVIACLRLMQSRHYLSGCGEELEELEAMGARLFAKLQAFRQALT